MNIWMVVEKEEKSMYKLTFALIASFLPLAAQTGTTGTPAPPTPSACLNAVLTQGTVTVSCSLIDNSAYGASGDVLGYVLQVKVASADPAVTAVRIQLNLSQAQPQNAPATTSTRIAVVSGSGGTFAYTFVLAGSTVDNTVNPPQALALTLTSVQVQELKPSSSTTF